MILKNSSTVVIWVSTFSKHRCLHQNQRPWTKGEKDRRANIGEWKPVQLWNSQNPNAKHWPKRLYIHLNQIEEFNHNSVLGVNFFKTLMLSPELKAFNNMGERRKSKYRKMEPSLIAKSLDSYSLTMAKKTLNLSGQYPDQISPITYVQTQN